MQKIFPLLLSYPSIFLLASAMDIFGNLRAESQGMIRVEISNIDASRPGKIQVSLFHTPEGFPANEKALRIVKILPSPTVVTNFNNLAFGEYAIVVVHDENENGRMDMKWLPYPHPGEGYSISNNATSRTGPPKFDPAKFKLTTSSLTVRLVLSY